ncbi:unnamed protein product [Echinostoma caproni]|uniref:G_PROTEIN_RECEP_F1_2 domain-containing protein n=1 Tax=Echinostoma caproni TaxID=27848 RepID=A0A183APS7_9TREM|nr:unnamed protein product [Echinostoma caproni]
MQTPEHWRFVDTPWDLTWECEGLKVGWTNVSRIGCVMSTILGVWSAYILPFVCGLSLIGTVFFMVIAILSKHLVTRQLIYMFCMFASNAATSVLFGWFWMFPAKGLPFATNGKTYLFTFYASPIACSIHRFAYSFTSTTSCNLLLLASIDRLLSVCFPMEFSNIPRRYGWYAVLFTLFISLFMLFPATALIRWTRIGGRINCWYPEPYKYMEYYHTLISNAAVLQPLAITVINIIIFSIIRRLAKQKQSEAVWTNQAKQSVRACVVLLIVSCVYVVCALPQSVAYICAYTIARTDPSQTRAIRLAYNVADLSLAQWTSTVQQACSRHTDGLDVTTRALQKEQAVMCIHQPKYDVEALNQTQASYPRNLQTGPSILPPWKHKPRLETDSN